MGVDRTVRDFVTLQRGITYKGSLVGSPGPALLGLGSIIPGGGFRESDYKTYGGECPTNITLYPGDLFASLKGATKDGKMIGSVARVPSSVSRGRLTQDTVKLEFKDPCKESSNYLYWVLRTPQYRDYCARHATGSAVVALSREDFLNYPVPALNLTRKKIVSFLEFHEKKININHQINTTLESMAQALFKSWFVDFDPVIDNALAAGNPIPEAMQARADARATLGDQRKPLPDHIRQQFPDRFVLTEEMGWVPEGWVVGPVSALAKLNPQAWTAKNHPEEIRYVDLSNTKKGRIMATEKYSFDDAPSRARRVLRKDDTIIGTVRPGNQAFAFIQDDGLTGSTGFAVLRPSESIHKCFVYCALTRRETIEYFAHIADGGAYPAIKPNVVGDHLILIPPTSVLTHFDAMASPLLTEFGQNELENRTLSDLRDTLLPKLLSGELRVPEAERKLEEAL